MARIIVYSGGACPECDRVRAWLDAQRLPYELRDVDDDDDAYGELMTLGFQGVPVTIIDGVAVRGFDEAMLTRALRRAGLVPSA